MQAQEASELKSYRLPGQIIEAIVDVAKGVEEGESGLKSCALGALVAAEAGAKGAEVAARHHRELQEIEDEDEYLNALGDLLAKGFGFDDAFKTIRLATDGIQLLALERWCQRIGLRCSADEELPTPHAAHRWKSTPEHDRRRRARRALAALRDTPAGTTHAAVLHVVYGWPDPFLSTIDPGARAALGEYAPLARYTDAVEAKRQELVKAEAASDQRRRYAPAIERLGSDAPPLQQLVVHAMEREEMHRLAVNHAAPPTAQVFDLERRRSRLAWADRMISSGDALRAGTDQLRTPDKDARKAFITAIRIDANRMFTAASEAFLVAWRAQ